MVYASHQELSMKLAVVGAFADGLWAAPATVIRDSSGSQSMIDLRRADLHAHTYCSDGHLSPSELVVKARQCSQSHGISNIYVTYLQIQSPPLEQDAGVIFIDRNEDGGPGVRLK